MRFYEFVDDKDDFGLNKNANNGGSKLPSAPSGADAANLLKKFSAKPKMDGTKKSVASEPAVNDDDYVSMPVDNLELIRPNNSATLLRFAKGTQWDTSNMQSDEAARQFTLIRHPRIGLLLLDPFTGNLITRDLVPVSRDDVIKSQTLLRLIKSMKTKNNKSIESHTAEAISNILSSVKNAIINFVRTNIDSADDVAELSKTINNIDVDTFRKWADRYNDLTRGVSHQTPITDIDEILSYIISTTEFGKKYPAVTSAIGNDLGLISKVNRAPRGTEILDQVGDYTVIRRLRSELDHPGDPR
jgi:hypothetical protein